MDVVEWTDSQLYNDLTLQMKAHPLLSLKN